MKLYEKEALEFAKENMFYGVKHMYDWNGFECYTPLNENGKMGFYGSLSMIVVNTDTKARFITKEESENLKDDIRSGRFSFH